MKDMYECATFAEIDAEFEMGRKRFKELMLRTLERQQNEDMRISYSGLRELIEALELNEFILENTDKVNERLTGA